MPARGRTGATAPKVEYDPEVNMQISRVNPDLGKLLRRLRTIHQLAGGIQRDKPKADSDTFDGRHSAVISRMDFIEKLCAARDSSDLEDHCREKIRLKLEVHRELEGLEDDIQKLMEYCKVEHQVIKKKKIAMSPEAIIKRKKILEALKKRHKKVVETASNTAVPESTIEGPVIPRLTDEDLAKDGPLPHSRVKRVEMTEGDRAMLSEIKLEEAKQEEILEEMSEVLMRLKESALAINDELDAQAVMLEDLANATSVTSDKLDKANKRVEGALEIVNSKSTNFCAYGICLILLLGILAVVYNMVSKN